jgi:hypothetical protein
MMELLSRIKWDNTDLSSRKFMKREACQKMETKGKMKWQNVRFGQSEDSEAHGVPDIARPFPYSFQPEDGSGGSSKWYICLLCADNQLSWSQKVITSVLLPTIGGPVPGWPWKSPDEYPRALLHTGIFQTQKSGDWVWQWAFATGDPDGQLDLGCLQRLGEWIFLIREDKY